MCCVLLNLTGDVALDMNWLHNINPVINWKNKLLSMECRYETVLIFVTKNGCSYANVEVCALKSVLKRCVMKSYRPSLVYYGRRPLPHCLGLLLGLEYLRVVMILLRKLAGLDCVTNTKMCLPI